MTTPPRPTAVLRPYHPDPRCPAATSTNTVAGCPCVLRWPHAGFAPVAVGNSGRREEVDRG